VATLHQTIPAAAKTLRQKAFGKAYYPEKSPLPVATAAQFQ